MREGFKGVCCKIEEGNQLLGLGLERDESLERNCGHRHVNCLMNL
jgi:hypothetical protein